MNITNNFKITWRSPKFFKHGGVWVFVMNKWYRVIPVNA